jgi:hypothetical protein
VTISAPSARPFGPLERHMLGHDFRRSGRSLGHRPRFVARLQHFARKSRTVALRHYALAYASRKVTGEI